MEHGTRDMKPDGFSIFVAKQILCDRTNPMKKLAEIPPLPAFWYTGIRRLLGREIYEFIPLRYPSEDFTQETPVGSISDAHSRSLFSTKQITY